MYGFESIFVCVPAVGFVCGLGVWRERRWLAWVGAGVFLGLGLLAKGPLNLFFLYAVVLTILWQARELRQLVKWPHLVGVVLMLGIFAAWAIPCLELMRAAHVTHVWSSQFTGRMGGDDFKLGSWILNIPRGIGYLLPWAILLPFARFQLLEDEADRKFCRALSLGVAVPFVIVSLLPGALPRYNMPLLAPAIWLLAILIKEHAFVWPIQLRKAITGTVVAVVLAMLIYTVGIIPFLQRREKIRPIGEQISAALPPNETLYAVDTD